MEEYFSVNSVSKEPLKLIESENEMDNILSKHLDELEWGKINSDEQICRVIERFVCIDLLRARDGKDVQFRTFTLCM